MKEGYRSFGERANEFGCPAPMIASLKSREVNALEAYRIAFAENLFELYKHMDPEEADDFVRPLMQRLAR